MTKLHDDLVAEVEHHTTLKASIAALLAGIVEREKAWQRTNDLPTILRENPAKLAQAVLANTGTAQGRRQSDAIPKGHRLAYWPDGTPHLRREE